MMVGGERGKEPVAIYIPVQATARDHDQDQISFLLNIHPSPTTRTMVRLITHNLLGCHVKNCNSNNFPLEFKNARVELVEAEFNPDFLRVFLPKIEWKALVDTARQVRLFDQIFFILVDLSLVLQLGDTSLPEEQPEMVDDDFLKALHHVLLEVRSYLPKETNHPLMNYCMQIHVEEGAMVCPNCKHEYPISNGIPNMVRSCPL